MGDNSPAVSSRYFFILCGPDGEDDDDEGTPFLSKSAALSYARRIARELKEAGGYDDPGLKLLVQDETGETIFAVPLSGAD